MYYRLYGEYITKYAMDHKTRTYLLDTHNLYLIFIPVSLKPLLYLSRYIIMSSHTISSNGKKEHEMCPRSEAFIKILNTDYGGPKYEPYKKPGKSATSSNPMKEDEVPLIGKSWYNLDKKDILIQNNDLKTKIINVKI